MAVPLTGAARISPLQFLAFDGLGAMFWSATYAVLGYIFSNQLDLVAVHLARIGAFVALALAAGFGFYLARRLVRWQHFVRSRRISSGTSCKPAKTF